MKVNSGSDEDDLIDDEQYQYISPYEASKSPMNDSPSLVKPEEIIIVSAVLILWISVIALFIHKWGKIRGLEPYIPHFDRTSIHTHPPNAVATAAATTNQVTGVTVQTAPSIYSSAAINAPSSAATASVTMGQVSVEGGIKSYSEASNTAGETSDASQVSHERVKRYNINNNCNPRVSNKTRVNLSSATRKTTGKEKWLQPCTRATGDWSSGGGRKFKCRATQEDKQMQVNKNEAGVGVSVVRDVISCRDNLQQQEQEKRQKKKKNVHSSAGDDYSCVREEEQRVPWNPANTVNERPINDNLSVNSGHSMDASRRKKEERIRRKRSREYFYPYSSRRPRASIDSSSITANHIAEFSLNSPLVSDERLLQSHGVDFHQSPYMKHKENMGSQKCDAKVTQSVQFHHLSSCYKPVHRWRQEEEEEEEEEQSTHRCDQVSKCETKTSDNTSGNKKNHIQLHVDDDEDACEQLNRPLASTQHKRGALKAREEILHEYRSYIDMPSLVLLRMAQSEPNIAESRLDS